MVSSVSDKVALTVGHFCRNKNFICLEAEHSKPLNDLNIVYPLCVEERASVGGMSGRKNGN